MKSIPKMLDWKKCSAFFVPHGSERALKSKGDLQFVAEVLPQILNVRLANPGKSDLFSLTKLKSK